MYSEKYIHLKHDGKIEGGLSSKRYNVLAKYIFVVFSDTFLSLSCLST